MSNFGRFGGAGSNEYGGGFMGGSQSGSQTSPGGGKSHQSTIRPVTIRQLLEATQAHPEAELNISGVETGSVTFVAQIHNISRLPTNVSMAMEDGTGSIDVRQWAQQNDVSTEEGEGNSDGLNEKEWVRVIGTVKTFHQKRNVNAMRIRKITDFNEINYHLLDAIRVTLYHERGPVGGPAAQTNGAAHDATSYVHGAGAGGAAPMDVDGYGGLPPLQRKIMMAIVNGNAGENGMHIDDIVRSVGAPRDKILEQLENLQGEGNLYTTLDENHFAPTA